MFRPRACLAALVLAAALASAPHVRAAQTRPQQQPQPAPTVVIVVRHGEKDASVEGNDPPLSEAGRRRAERLAAVAAEAGVAAAYTTQFKRTRETARPAVERLKIPVTHVEVTRESAASHPSDLAKEILSKHRGQTVLVVGHSNTAPRVAAALSGKTIPDLDDATEFDALFVVVIPESGQPVLVRAKY